MPAKQLFVKGLCNFPYCIIFRLIILLLTHTVERARICDNEVITQSPETTTICWKNV